MDNSSCRNNTLKGEKNHFCKISENTVREICRLLEDYTLSYSKIADMTGSTKSNICSIARRKTWTHISDGYSFPDRKGKSSTKDKSKLIESRRL